MTPLPKDCPDCSIPLHGESCRHCGWVEPEPRKPAEWLAYARQKVEQGRHPKNVTPIRKETS